jgi:hypothetical protein
MPVMFSDSPGTPLSIWRYTTGSVRLNERSGRTPYASMVCVRHSFTVRSSGVGSRPNRRY